MNVRLTPGQEAIIEAELKSSHFRSIEEVIGEALQALREKERSSTAAAPSGNHHEAVREMLAFVETYHTRLDGISIKELIHGAHRL